MRQTIGGFIGTYKIRREGHDKPLILESLNIIEPVSEWPKTVQYKYTGSYNSKPSRVNAGT